MTSSPTIPELVLYTRDGCHLCVEAREAIELVLEERRAARRPIPTLREVDIAKDPELERSYRERIPVVTLGDERVELIVGPRHLARLVERVLDGVTAG